MQPRLAVLLVEFAIERIAGIAVLRRPDLQARRGVARDGGHLWMRDPVWLERRALHRPRVVGDGECVALWYLAVRTDGIAGSFADGLASEDRVRFDEERDDALPGEEFFETRFAHAIVADKRRTIGTFGQPEGLGTPTKVTGVRPHTRPHLRENR